MAGENGIPDDVRRFVEEHVDSLEQLELLLLLRRKEEVQWTAVSAARELGMSTESAARALDRLCARNLLDVTIGSSLTFRLRPARDDQARGVRSLAQAYERNRIEVIGLVAAKRPDPMQGFAEAFRLKGSKKDG